MNFPSVRLPKDAPSDREPSQAPPEGDDGHEAAAHGGDGAERQRRYRLRQLAGIRVVTIEVNDATMDLMMALGWLEEWDQDDRESIAEAVERIVEEHLLSGD